MGRSWNLCYRSATRENHPLVLFRFSQSVQGTAVLTFIFGDSFRFTDTSEEYFGLPARTFPLFREAANEAAVSRLYGGKHVREAIEQGQGQAIAGFII